LPSLTAHGVRLDYALEGPAGAPLVTLSNSLASDRLMWDAQMPALAARFRVLRYDTRGHGASAVPPAPYAIESLADDLAALLDGLGIAGTHLVGLSLGGMTAQMLALRRPDLVRSLCLCATAAAMPPAGAAVWTERIAGIRARGSLDHLLEVTLERWLSPATRTERPDAAAGVRRMIAATPIEGYMGCAAAAAGIDIVGRLGAVRVPTLVVAGADDPATTVADAERIRDGIAGATLTVIPGARHLLSVDAPERLTAILDGWLAARG